MKSKPYQEAVQKKEGEHFSRNMKKAPATEDLFFRKSSIIRVHSLFVWSKTEAQGDQCRAFTLSWKQKDLLIHNTFWERDLSGLNICGYYWWVGYILAGVPSEHPWRGISSSSVNAYFSGVSCTCTISTTDQHSQKTTAWCL